jgi:hypothetical protein
MRALLGVRAGGEVIDAAPCSGSFCEGRLRCGIGGVGRVDRVSLRRPRRRAAGAVGLRSLVRCSAMLTLVCGRPAGGADRMTGRAALRRGGRKRCRATPGEVFARMVGIGVVALLAALPCVSSPSTAVAASTGFLASPTEQLAVPGALAGGEITPEGNSSSGWAEYDLRFGRKLLPWNQPTRTLPDAALPLVSSTLSEGAVRYTREIFAVMVGGVPVAYDTVTAHNTSGRDARAELAMAISYTHGPEVRGVRGNLTGAYRYERPSEGQPPGYYDQPGQSFSASFVYGVSGRDLDRSGLLLARGPAAVGRAIAYPKSDSVTALHDGWSFGAVLGPHDSVRYTWQVLLDPVAVASGFDRTLEGEPLGRALAQLRGTWQAEEAGMMRISVPEGKVTDTYLASLVEMLASRYQSSGGWVEASNKL